LIPHIHLHDIVMQVGVKSEYELVKFLLHNMKDNTTLYKHKG